MEYKPYYTEDHTKGTFVKRKQNGQKITITINKGTTINYRKTFLGTEVLEED